MRFIVLITKQKKNYSILNREQRSTRSKFTIKSKKNVFSIYCSFFTTSNKPKNLIKLYKLLRTKNKQMMVITYYIKQFRVLNH